MKKVEKERNTGFNDLARFLLVKRSDAQRTWPDIPKLNVSRDIIRKQTFS